MEVKINKDIQSYSESMFFGLSMRQCGFSLAAMLVAVGLYFLLKPYVGTETVSWIWIRMPFSPPPGSACARWRFSSISRWMA